MFYYWYRVSRILLARNFQKQVDIQAELSRKFTVRLLDCDGMRVMTASQYAAYMDFIRWEMIARSRLYHEIVLKGLAPTLGSQKIIYRKPLKRWTSFTLKLRTAGWDEKWIYHIHQFKQKGEIKAVGVTKALIWKKDKPQLLQHILKKIGVQDLHNPPPDWVLHLFQHDANIINGRIE